MKRILSVLIAMVMVIGMIPLAELPAFADGPYPALSLGENPVEITDSRNSFTFTPEESGKYSFYSTSDQDTIATLYDASENYLDSNDDGGEGNNFLIRRNLTAGETYVLSAGFYSGSTGSCTIVVEATKSLTGMEVTVLPARTTFVRGYFRDYFDINGLELLLSWSDGATSEWSVDRDGRYIDGEYLDYDTSDTETTGLVTLQCGSVETTFAVEIIENPVVRVETETPSEETYFEELGGYLDGKYNEEDEYVEFYHYYTHSHSDAVIRVYFADGTSETATLGEKLRGYDFTLTDTQYNSPWAPGGENTMNVTYLGVAGTLPVMVEENPVDHIEAEAVQPLYENAGGYWDLQYNDETGEYERQYYYDYSASNIAVTVYYKNGTVETTTGGSYLNGYYVNCSDNQYDVSWTVGGANEVTVTYMNRNVTFSMPVEECPVDHMEASMSTPLYENISGYTTSRYNDETGAYEEYFYYYFNESDIEITVYYKDGTTAITHPGESLNGYYVDCNAKQSSAPWTVGGANEAVITYMGVEYVFSVPVESSPYLRIEATSAEPVQMIENLNGYESNRYNPETDEYEPYFHYYLPATNDIDVTIYYTDGSTRTVSANEYVDGQYISVSDTQDDSPWTLGTNYLQIAFADQTTTFPVEVVENPVDHLEAALNSPIYEDISGHENSRYNPETGDYDPFFYYSFNSDMLDVTVWYKDGTSAATHPNCELNGYYINLSTDQYNEPWTVGGANKATISYMGISCEYSVPVSPNPVDHIEVHTEKDIQLIENVDGSQSYRYNAEIGNYEPYFEYRLSSNQFEIVAYNTDGTQKTLSFYEVNTTSDQNASPWGLGSHEFLFTYAARTAVLAVEVVETPVERIEVLSGTRNYIENYSGYDNGGYFYYYVNTPSDAKIRVYFKDGSTADGRPGYSINGYRVEWSVDQAADSWSLGSDNFITLSYMGASANLPVTVIANPVARVTAEVVQPVIKEVTGSWNSRYDYETGREEDYFSYELGSKAIVATIYFKDGSAKTLTYGNSLAIEGAGSYGLSYRENQYDHHWTPGGENVLYVSFLGVETTTSVPVIEDPVDHIEVSLSQPVEWIENLDGWISGYYDETGAYVSARRYSTGSNQAQITVYYQDGNTTVCDANDTLNGYDIEVSDTQDDEPWGLGEHPVTVSYLGHEAVYTVSVVENPVDFIAVTTSEPLFLVENQGGYWANSYGEDGSVTQFYYYGFQNENAVMVEVHYKNGTVMTTRPSQSLGGYYVSISGNAQYDEPWGLGEHAFVVSYMDREAPLPVTVVEDPVDHIEARVEGGALRVVENTHGISVIQYNEETGEDEEFYFYDEFNEDQVQVTVYFKDGTTAQGSLWGHIKGYFVDCETDQWENHWGVGNHNAVITYLGHEAPITVTVVENPVDHIEAVVNTPVVYVENTRGRWSSRRNDEGEEEQYYNYSLYYSDDVDVVIYYKDGTIAHARLGDTVGDDEIRPESDQWEHPWTLGGENHYDVVYCGCRAEVPVTITNDPVDHIEATVVSPITLREKIDGYWTDYFNPETNQNEHFFYYQSPRNAQVQVTVYFKDGTTAQGNLWSNIGGYSIEYMTDQYTNPWSPGRHTATVSYLDHTAEITLEVVENPVDHIEARATEPILLAKDISGWWNGNEEDRYFYYNSPRSDQVEVTIYYKNGTTVFAHLYDEIDNSWINANSDQWEHHWDLGEHTFTIQYGGMEATVTATVIEPTVDHIEWNGSGSVTYIAETGGRMEWRFNMETDSEEQFYCYDEPNADQVPVTIYYKDGTTAQANLNDVVGGFRVMWSSDQWETPWISGNYTAQVEYMGATAEVPVTIVRGQVDHITAMLRRPLTLLENVDGELDWIHNEETGEDEEYFRYYGPDPAQIEVTIFYEGGTTVTADVWDNIGGANVEYIDHQEEAHWSVGDHTVTIRYMDCEATLTVTVAENPVDHIEAELRTPIRRAEGENGRIERRYNEETGEDEEFFCYNAPGPDQVDVTIYYKNGETRTARLWDDIDGYRVDWYDDQWENAWGPGEHTAYITYMGASAPVLFTIVESPVDHLEVNVLRPVQLIEGDRGRMDYRYNEETGEDEEYFRYDGPDSDCLEITAVYKDGTSEQVRLYDEYDGFRVEWQDDQNENPWSPGEHTGYVTFMGAEAPVVVSIIESPIDHIEVCELRPVQLIEGDRGRMDYRYNEETGEDEEYFRYDGPDSNDLEITVYYKDGNSEQVRLYNEYGGFRVEWRDSQNDQPWSLGEHTGYVSYMGAEAAVTVSIIESPINRIEARVVRPIRYTEGDNGNLDYRYNEETGEDEEYFRYNAPGSDQVKVTVFYNDGTTAQVQLWDEVDGFRVDWYDDQNENPWGLGDHTGYITFMGKSAPVTITVEESPVDHVDVNVLRPVQLIEGDCGRTDYRYNEETGEDEEYFRYDGPDSNDLEITVYYKDGSSEQVRLYDEVNGYRVEWRDNQHEEPWGLGEHIGCVAFMGAEAPVTVSIIESPVERIEVRALQELRYAEGDHGEPDYYHNDETGEDEEYFRYYSPADDALEITVFYKDGSSRRVRLYNEYDGFRVDWRDDQWENHWGVGDHTGYITFMGAEAPVTVTVVESPVDHIVANVLRPIRRVLNGNGRMEMRYNDETGRDEEFFCYDGPYYEELTATVYFKDGTIAEVRPGDEINGFRVDWRDDQWDAPWGVGEHTGYITFMGAAAPITVTVFESPVSRIALNVSGEITRYVNDTGELQMRYNEETGEDEEFFCYYAPGSEQVEVTIYYKDGTQKTTRLWDEVDGYRVDWRDDQERNPWGVGAHIGYVTYMDAEAPVTITILENPVDHLELNRAPDREYYYGDVLFGEITESGYHFCPADLNGLQFTIVYSDGTRRLINASEDMDEAGMAGFGFQVDTVEEFVEPGEVETRFTLAGKSIQYTVILKESTVARICVIDPPAQTEYQSAYYALDPVGMSFEITYTNGSARLVTATRENVSFHYDPSIGFVSVIHDGEETALIYNDFGGDEPGYHLNYLGADCTISGVTVGSTEDVSKVELLEFDENGTLKLNVTYADGSAQLLNVTPRQDPAPFAAGQLYFGDTENGPTGYYVEYVEEGDYYQVIVLDRALRYPEAPAVIWSDVDNSGDVTMNDAILLLKYLADLVGADDINIEAADVDGVEGVTMADAIYLLKYLADLVPALG